MVTRHPKGTITFNIVHDDFKLNRRLKIKECIYSFVSDTSFRMGQVNIIFCTDEYLLSINQKYLQHDTFTDIITFDYRESKNIISGDIFISVDRIVENAEKYGVSFAKELYRVMVHGILHLMGNSDRTKRERADMTAKEDMALAYFEALL